MTPTGDEKSLFTPTYAGDVANVAFNCMGRESKEGRSDSFSDRVPCQRVPAVRAIMLKSGVPGRCRQSVPMPNLRSGKQPDSAEICLIIALKAAGNTLLD